MQSLAATEAKNRFGRVLRQLTQTNEPIMIRRDGQPVAIMLSIAEYNKLHMTDVPVSTTVQAQSAFGMWRDRDDLDDEWLNKGRDQWHSTWRNDDN
jgi:prevent-host-death family protein